MVDASLRMSIVGLFRALRDEMRVSIIYITHDLATAYTISDRLIIMRHGRVVESGSAREVLDNPRDEYSILLKNAVLSVDFEGIPRRWSRMPDARVVLRPQAQIGTTDPRLFGVFIEVGGSSTASINPEDTRTSTELRSGQRRSAGHHRLAHPRRRFCLGP